MSVVCEFPKNQREVVRAVLGDVKGTPTASLWVFAPTRSGAFVPTKKGLTLSVDSLPQLEDAVRQLRAAVAQEGPR